MSLMKISAATKELPFEEYVRKVGSSISMLPILKTQKTII
jgi:hypothetical protein